MKDILIRNRFFAVYASVLEYEQDINFDKEVKPIIVVDISLHSLRWILIGNFKKRLMIGLGG